MVTAVLGISQTPLQIQAKEVEKLTRRRTDVFIGLKPPMTPGIGITNEASCHIIRMFTTKTVVTTPFKLRIIWGLKNVVAFQCFMDKIFVNDDFI